MINSADVAIAIHDLQLVGMIIFAQTFLRFVGVFTRGRPVCGVVFPFVSILGYYV